MGSSAELTVDLGVPTGVDVPRADDVADYVRRFPDVSHLLPRVCEAVLARFGGRAQIVLDVYRDPEAEDEYLAIEIRQPAYPADILGEIESLSRAFDADLAGCDGWLLVTTDFQPPTRQS